MIELDARVFRAVHEALGGAHVLWVMAALTVLGNGWILLGAFPLLARARTRRFAAALLGVVATQATLVAILKALVQRARPCRCLEGVHARIFAAPTDYSFPSGHSAGSFAFAAFVAGVVLASPRAETGPLASDARRWAIVALVYAFAVGVAVSRIALGVHFPGDVAAGAALGTAIGLAGARLHLRAAARGEKAHP